KRLDKDREEINPRIDEIQRGLDVYAGATDTADIEVERATLNVDIKGLETDWQAIIAKETERQQRIENLNALKSKKLQREGELRNDTTGIKGLLDEKAKIEAGAARCRQAAVDANSAIVAEQSTLRGLQATVDGHTRGLVAIRDEYKSISEAKDATKCFTCQQDLPQEMLAGLDLKKQERLSEISKRGELLRAQADAAMKLVAEKEATIATLRGTLEKAQITLKEAETYKADRFEKIDALVKTNQTLPPERDQLWKNLTAEIDKAESEIGDPASKQLQNIEIERGLKMEALAKCNTALSQVDRMQKDKARIVELEVKEKELAQQVSEIDRLLAGIDEYGAAESKMI
ncbi:MAG: hypothetical protein Q7T18_10395, partial [Sedimentisphaerales bacterium]|nr:hypothetical protein [Sedimentisphaerales bacterium]